MGHCSRATGTEPIMSLRTTGTPLSSAEPKVFEESISGHEWKWIETVFLMHTFMHPLRERVMTIANNVYQRKYLRATYYI